MKIDYTVFSADQVSVLTEAALPNGNKVQAKVQALRVQLVNDAHGTIALTLIGSDADAWSKTPGQTVTITLE